MVGDPDAKTKNKTKQHGYLALFDCKYQLNNQSKYQPGLAFTSFYISHICRRDQCAVYILYSFWPTVL